MDVYLCGENNEFPVYFGKSDEFLHLLLKGKKAHIPQKGKIGDFSRAALCLGYFDGVHIAHRSLFEKAKAKGRWGVLLFDRNVKGIPLLTTQYEKVSLIERSGADFVIIAEFSENFKNRSPYEFAEFLKNTLKVSGVVAGYDYRFGKSASGDAKILKKLSCDLGFSAEIVEAECEDGEPVKSTKIREYIKNGEMTEANKLLGYNYIVSGRVEKGLGNGRKIGFPTANIGYDPEKLLPQDGVYHGRVLGKDAVINIGKNPTFDAKRRTIEAHLIDYDGDIYGKMVEVSFLKKTRDDIKFATEEELKKQIEEDVRSVKED